MTSLRGIAASPRSTACDACEAIIRQHNTTLPSLAEVEAMIEVAAAAQVDLD
jgi:hypothetical protein